MMREFKMASRVMSSVSDDRDGQSVEFGALCAHVEECDYTIFVPEAPYHISKQTDVGPSLTIFFENDVIG
jgi:hypothetical protein